MMANANGGKTAAVILLVVLALSCATNGANTARKERKDVPRKITSYEAEQLLHREKRDAPSSSPGSDDQKLVVINEIVLNGTEHFSSAYVHWSENNTADTILILTVKYNSTGIADSTLWRSKDYGSTYTKFSFSPHAQVSYFYVSPADSAKMVFTNRQNKTLYTTNDELNTLHSVSIPVASDEIYMHPYKSDWMLLYYYAEKELYVTMDFGAHWTKLSTDVFDFHWAVEGVDSPDIVHIEVHPWDSENAFYKRCTIPNCNSTGDGIDTQLGPFLTYSMQVLNEYIFVQRVLMNGKESHMLVSHKRQNFSNAYFPDNVKTQDFEVLDASEGQVFVAVNHGNRMGASLYLSDPTGHYYVLSLANVHHQSFGHWFDVDIHKVQGLNGTYLANQLLDVNSGKLKSLISFNKGGDWLEIPSPKSSQCKSADCSLVLRLDMENYFSNWILSEKRAPGFIVAHGHYGHEYEVTWSNLTVFTSNDSGWTWTESSLKGVYHFNILDQGSIVTAIKTGYRENSSQVYYSYDEGTTWHSEMFKNETLHIRGILKEPGIRTLVLNVYGHKNHAAPWTLLKLNFSKVLSRQCNDHDYTDWMTSDHDKIITENCLLGQQVTYKRKKSASQCFNGKNFDRTISKTACNCTKEDFECDFGFTWHNETCKRESWFDDGYIAPECTENQPFKKSRGYRKVGSDKCVNGVSSQDKYKVDTQAICPLVKPGLLVLTANLTVVAAGQPVLFHLLQKRGSIHTTQYTWNFNDSHPINKIGLHNAQHQTHVFWRQGLFDVTVSASNAKGSVVSNQVKIRSEYPVRRVAVFSQWAVRVGVPITVSASANVWYRSNSTLHFLFRFGDERKESKELLTYSSNVTHIYNTSGLYTVSVTAVNSISATTKEIFIEVIDDGIVAQLTFSPNVERVFRQSRYYFYYEGIYYWLQRFRQELTKAVGISLDRMAVSLNSTNPVRMDCLILPKPPKASDDEMTAEQISQSLVDLVNSQSLSLFQNSPYGRWYGPMNVTSIHINDFTGNGGGNTSGNGTHDSGNSTAHGGDHGKDANNTHHGHNKNKDDGVNYRAIYIAVPIVAVAGIVTVIFIIYYRRRSRGQRYSLLNQDGGGDSFFEDDDDLPLDMSDARDSGRSRDDPMLDLRTGN